MSLDIRRGLEELAKAIEKDAAAKVEAARIEAEGRRIAAKILAASTR